jgi:hypothetical protein
MGQLLGLREPPTAVYAHSDEIALGAVRTLRRAGLRIPEDISVIGIDNHPLAELTDLTTVSQPVYEQGQLAGQMVLGLLQGEDIEQLSPYPPGSSSAGAPPRLGPRGLPRPVPSGDAADLVFALAGVLVVDAAVTYKAAESGGIDKALLALATSRSASS